MEQKVTWKQSKNYDQHNGIVKVFNVVNLSFIFLENYLWYTNVDT